MASQEYPHPDLPISEAILWEIVESVNDAVITIDEDHRVLVCNRAAEKMFGYERGEIAGRDVSPLIPDPHRDVHADYVERYLRTGTPRVIGKARECYGQRRNGELFPVEISYSVSKTKGHFYFTAVIRDISERKSQEHKIRFMERLADVGKAVAHVVHEIRKPLMLIGGFARQVESCGSMAGDAKNRQKLNIIIEEVRRLEKLLNSIRLLSRPPTASRKSVLDINTVLKDTIELLEPMLQDQQVDLQIKEAPEPLVTQGDPDQLKQVFLNIMHNSLEAMQGVGTICITSRVAWTMVQIVIEDDGPGIPEAFREKIFDPFFTTKSEGTGLGLAISRDIVRDHGGSLTMQPRTGRGVTFMIELPLEAGYNRE